MRAATSICIALLAGFSATVNAQSDATRLVGRVLEPNGRDPLAGVAVRLGDRRVSTDRRGYFLIAPVEPGRHELRFELIGYAARTDSVTIGSGETTDVQVRLTTRPVELPPLVVMVRSRWLELNGSTSAAGRTGRQVHHPGGHAREAAPVLPGRIAPSNRKRSSILSHVDRMARCCYGLVLSASGQASSGLHLNTRLYATSADRRVIDARA